MAEASFLVHWCFILSSMSVSNLNINTLFYYISLFSPCSPPGPTGHQPSKLADWGSSGPESNTNGHGPASTLPRMTSHSNSNTEQGKRHTHMQTTCTYSHSTESALQSLLVTVETVKQQDKSFQRGFCSVFFIITLSEHGTKLISTSTCGL